MNNVIKDKTEKIDHFINVMRNLELIRDLDKVTTTAITAENAIEVKIDFIDESGLEQKVERMKIFLDAYFDKVDFIKVRQSNLEFKIWEMAILTKNWIMNIIK